MEGILMSTTLLLTSRDVAANQLFAQLSEREMKVKLSIQIA